MRKFKRLASLALAAVMTLAMCAPAFAETTPTETTGTTYDVYQIFTGQYLEQADKSEVLSNVKWGTNGIGKAEDDVDTVTLDALLAIDKTQSNPDKVNAIKTYVNLDSEPYASNTRDVVGENGLHVVPGYYLVKNHGDSSIANGEAATIYVVNVTGTTLKITPKVSVPTVEKKIVDDTDPNVEGSTSAAAIGSILTFKLTGTMPENIGDYKSYSYKFTDTMSKGLNYVKDSASVKIDDTEITDSIFINFENQILTIGTKNLKDFGVALTKDTVVTVVYKAEINNDAETGKDPNTNKVKLSYSNNPDKTSESIKNDPTDPDPEDPTSETVDGIDKGETKTYITGLTVKDFAITDGIKKPMTDAEFTLTGDKLNVVLKVEREFVRAGDGEWYKLKDGKYTKTEPTEETAEQYESTTEKYKVEEDKITTIGDTTPNHTWSATIGKDGSLTISGLNAGNYTLHQTKSPDGYNMVDDIVFTIEFNETDLFSCKDNQKVVEGTGADGTKQEWFYIEIEQKLGSLLPETGGIGTTLLYIGGVLLIAVAGATFILRGKKEEEAI